MIFRTFKIVMILIAATIFMSSCGDPTVSIENAGYEPKIVVNAFIYPGQSVNNIYIMRNFKLNTKIDTSILYLTPSMNEATVAINGTPLQFNDTTKTYYNKNLFINYGTTYRLSVSAIIDGISLITESYTTTPNAGFEILNHDLGTNVYRENDLYIDFMPSPGTSFYLFSYKPDSASFDNYINNNPFLPNLEPDYFEENYFRFLFQFNVLLNINSYSTEPIQLEIMEYDTWFYANYRVIAYAGDDNFKDYFLTASRVQQFDGNFIEPEFHLTGEGIGVFGSAVRDTVTFSIIPNN